MRFRRPRSDGAESRAGTDSPQPRPALDAQALGSVFTPPGWLRDLGLLSWIVLGVLGVIVVVAYLLGLMSTIVLPVVTAGIVAAVAAPAVSWLGRHRIPRAGGAAIVLLSFFVLAAVVFLLVVSGIYANKAQIQDLASQALDTVEGWAKDAGADGTSGPKQDVSSAVSGSGSKLLTGVVNGIEGLTSLAFFLSFTFFSLFFLVKDGPTIKRFIDGHLGIPRAVAAIITGNVIVSMRRYFFGVTIVAAFNGVVVGIAAVLLGVPLAGTIAVVTFVTAYVPFIGAFVSGAFAVIIALASQGTTVALAMLVVVVLANGALQQIVQPIAFGATLDLNPLAVLIVTIAGGSLFGMLGLILAAPLTSAVIHIAADIARARASEEAAAPVAVEQAEPSPP